MSVGVISSTTGPTAAYGQAYVAGLEAGIACLTDDGVIDGKEIRPGDRIAMFAYGVHHSPKYWDQPEEFRPERWIGDAAKKRTPYTYLPFGGGKR